MKLYKAVLKNLIDFFGKPDTSYVLSDSYFLSLEDAKKRYEKYQERLIVVGLTDPIEVDLYDIQENT